MQTKRRWLKSVIVAAQQPMPALPWERKRQAQATTATPDTRCITPCPQVQLAR